jgi:hypothetical protein
MLIQERWLCLMRMRLDCGTMTTYLRDTEAILADLPLDTVVRDEGLSISPCRLLLSDSPVKYSSMQRLGGGRYHCTALSPYVLRPASPDPRCL